MKNRDKDWRGKERVDRDRQDADEAPEKLNQDKTSMSLKEKKSERRRKNWQNF